MSTRKLMNKPVDVVDEALEGLELAHPQLLAWNRDPSFIHRARFARPEKVTLVSGGGSGHEPLHSCFVGTGMLDAAVPGAVFASPTADQIIAATQAVGTEAGVVHVVKNYTGDVLNFQIAAETAADEGLRVECVLVDDDLASESDIEDGPGRRGTAAVVAVEKVCGAAAENGASLDTVVELGRRVAAGSRTMALALRACTHPDQDRPSFDLADNEVEMGVGIHGERGRERVPFGTADELVDSMLPSIIDSLGLTRGDRVLAITNGLGATHPLELHITHRAVAAHLARRGIHLARSLVGTYVTALDMSGCSITLTRVDDEMLTLWDAPVRTPALTW
ncbi:dihydroxyacetone kinase subunit DhaK [Pseudonocardia spinosispora]|uniref:dihydroxyacetone kinase subunit DhaK n=1 Tax=Pseudonocardia spinosispora TaxID=103441 RepID=UPI0003FD06A4|nr:dihydroxyacetone kinase subunit DhaK [Pseudonocardia spinosispora]